MCDIISLRNESVCLFNSGREQKINQSSIRNTFNYGKQRRMTAPAAAKKTCDECLIKNRRFHNWFCLRAPSDYNNFYNSPILSEAENHCYSFMSADDSESIPTGGSSIYSAAASRTWLRFKLRKRYALDAGHCELHLLISCSFVDCSLLCLPRFMYWGSALLNYTNNELLSWKNVSGDWKPVRNFAMPLLSSVDTQFFNLFYDSQERETTLDDTLFFARSAALDSV